MNLVNHYIFTPPVDLSVNTEIGGVASIINTPQLLATKLSIDVSRITNFSIIGSDIKCRISGSYALSDTFNYFDVSQVKSYIDREGLVSEIGYLAFNSTLLVTGYFPNATSIGNNAFDQNTGSQNKNDLRLLYIPRVLNIGATILNDSVFRSGNLGGAVIYAHPTLQTINSGGLEGDLAYLATGNTLRYVTNFTAPNSITNLSIGTVYASAIQLNFTAPTGSVNAIDFYECYANGVYKNTITGSGGFITGLLPNTSYSIEVKPADILLNKSNSNVVVQSTIVAYYTDTDANAYISAASLTSSEQESAYKLIVDLKANSLWTKIQALYPFKGTTAAQHKFNAKNPIDTDVAFRLNFFGAGRYSNLGFQCNGANTYANSNLIPSAVQDVNSNGITLVSGTNNNAGSTNFFDAGAYVAGTQMSLISLKNNNTNWKRIIRLNGTEISSSGVNDAKGIWTGTKQSATLTKLFKNGASILSGNSGGTLPNIALHIGSNNSNGVNYDFSLQRYQIAIIHEGLSDAEVATLHSIIDLSESIAGRKTW